MIMRWRWFYIDVLVISITKWLTIPSFFKLHAGVENESRGGGPAFESHPWHISGPWVFGVRDFWGCTQGFLYPLVI